MRFMKTIQESVSFVRLMKIDDPRNFYKDKTISFYNTIQMKTQIMIKIRSGIKFQIRIRGNIAVF